jgi:hypothetical protein
MNIENTKPIPKSLHTVRVLVTMAKLMEYNKLNGATDTETALEAAIYLLGYANAPDVHGLFQQALRQLNKGN